MMRLENPYLNLIQYMATAFNALKCVCKLSILCYFMGPAEGCTSSEH